MSGEFYLPDYKQFMSMSTDPFQVESVRLPATVIQCYDSNKSSPKPKPCLLCHVLSGACFRVEELRSTKHYFWILLCLVFKKAKQNKALNSAE